MRQKRHQQATLLAPLFLGVVAKEMIALPNEALTQLGERSTSAIN